MDGVENDLKIMGVRGWRKTARDIDAWKVILNVARVLHAPLSQRRKTGAILDVLSQDTPHMPTSILLDANTR